MVKSLNEMDAVTAYFAQSHPDVAVRRKVARDINTPVDVLEALLGDEDGRVVAYATANPMTPVASAGRTLLATERSTTASKTVRSDVRLWIVRNGEDHPRREGFLNSPTTTETELWELVNDDDIVVRCFVARRATRLTVAMIERIGNDPEPAVRCSLALGARMSQKDHGRDGVNSPFFYQEVARVLADDESEDVRQAFFPWASELTREDFRRQAVDIAAFRMSAGDVMSRDFQ